MNVCKDALGQRGDFKSPGGAMVYRVGMTILKRRPCITGRAAVAEDGLFVTSAR